MGSSILCQPRGVRLPLDLDIWLLEEHIRRVKRQGEAAALSDVLLDALTEYASKRGFSPQDKAR